MMKCFFWLILDARLIRVASILWHVPAVSGSSVVRWALSTIAELGAVCLVPAGIITGKFAKAGRLACCLA